MIGADDSVSIFGSVFATAGMAAIAWFFRQWSKGIGDSVDDVKDSVDDLKRDVSDRLDRGDERMSRMESNIDDGRQRIAYLAGALGSPQTPPILGSLNGTDANPDKGARPGRRRPWGA